MKNIKNKPISFADKSREIIRKYKRASWDATEKKELETELAKLAQEQEEYKAVNGIGVNTQMAFGGQFGEYDNSFDDTSAIQDISKYSKNLNYMTQGALKSKKPLSTPPSVLPYISSVPGSSVAPYSPAAEQQYEPYSTSIAPSVVSGLTSLVGNLYLGNKAGKYVKIKSSSVAPEQISLANERQRLSREGVTAGNIAMQNIRTSSRSRGEYMGNVGQAITGLNKNIGNAIGQSYQTEVIQNAQARQRANEINAQAQTNANQYNAYMANQAQQNKQAYQSAAAEAIPQMIGNINQLQQNDALINSRAGDYQVVMSPTEKKAWELWKRGKSPKVIYKGKKS